MTAIIATKNDFASDGGHWYDAKTGAPRYTVTGANGKVRNSTLADARKLGFVPSVTTIAKVEAKPQLTNWLVQQGMMACLTLPRIAGEDDTQFIKRALEDSKQQVYKAAERGTYLHGLMEKSMEIGLLTCDASAEDAEYVLPLLQWIWDNFPGYRWHTEKSFAHPDLKFGGKVDLHGTHETLPSMILDYKFKDFKDADKKLAYPEHCSQLCAYAVGLDFPVVPSRLINIFASSTKPGLFTIKEWDREEKEYSWRAFRAMLDLWQARNKF
jgi:hypothetical protein